MSVVLHAALVLLLLLVAQPASAHLPMGNVGGFSGGLLHPILVVPHAMGLVALGLLIGRGRDPMLAGAIFVLALIGGLVAIAMAVGETRAGDVLVVDAAFVGLLVASGWVPPRVVTWCLAAIAGGAIALDSPPDATTIAEGNLMLLGTALGASIALAAVIELARRLKRDWQRIGMRIAGSWIAASAILVLAVRFAGGDLP
jgi:urease accessory protein